MFSLSEEKEHFLQSQLPDDLDRLLISNHHRTHDISTQILVGTCKKYNRQRHFTPNVHSIEIVSKKCYLNSTYLYLIMACGTEY